MSKTNHRKGNVKKRYVLGQSDGRYRVFSNGRTSMDGTHVGAGSTASSEASRSIQRQRAGAKKFVQSRTRFRDRMSCDRIVREGYPDGE